MSGSRDVTSVKYYVSCAFTYLTAMVSSNMALQHVNYPTQVIGKSCKPIPVMILGVLLARKSYPLKKYIFTLMIIVGVALFVWKDGKSSTTDDGNLYGYLLLLLSLAMDGFTGAIQDRIRLESEVRFAPLMYNINLWASLMLCAVTLATGELAAFVDFVTKYPIVMQEIMWFSILSALGQVCLLGDDRCPQTLNCGFAQLFIYLTVADFGPLPCSIVTTTRKFFTVLLSIIYFGNPATSRQYVGTVFVFGGLALDSWKGKQPKKPKTKEQPSTKD